MGASTHILKLQPLNPHLPHTPTYVTFHTHPHIPTTQSPSPTHSNLWEIPHTSSQPLNLHIPHTSSNSNHSVYISHTPQPMGASTHPRRPAPSMLHLRLENISPLKQPALHAHLASTHNHHAMLHHTIYSDSPLTISNLHSTHTHLPTTVTRCCITQSVVILLSP